MSSSYEAMWHRAQDRISELEAQLQAANAKLEQKDKTIEKAIAWHEERHAFESAQEKPAFYDSLPQIEMLQKGIG